MQIRHAHRGDEAALGHLLEDFRGSRITLGQILREGQVDAGIFLLRRDRNGKDFTFGQV